MRQERHDSDFHAETAKILRRERKAALSLCSLRFFDLESSLRALREISGRGFQQKHYNIKKDLFVNFDFKPTLKPN